MKQTLLREGAIAGLLGAGAVAIWFLILDVLTREAFFTPAALFSAFFRNASTAAEVEISLWTVAGYTIVHVATFLVLGLIAAALIRGAEETPAFLLYFVEFFVTFEVAFFGLVLIVAYWILGVLGWWSIAIGNLIAAAVMILYLWKQHPKLRSDLDRSESFEDQLAHQ